MSDKTKYTQRQWDRVVGWGKVPPEYAIDEPITVKSLKRELGTPKIDRTIPSPCISVCLLDPTNTFCIGCYRSTDEIRDWCIMNAEEKIIVLKEIENRKKESS